jgi:hypothetical protein
MKTRLSSDNLYHFTSKLETLKLILQNGFRHSLITELLPNSHLIDKKLYQQNYLVCFCDIKPGENSFHKKCYGHFALGMSKQWGINNKVSPVQYIHPSSRGTESIYYQLKQSTKELVASEQAFKSHPSTLEIIARNFIVWAHVSDPSNKLSEKDIENLCDDLIKATQKIGKQDSLRNFVMAMRNRVMYQHHFLESRDPFHRNYKEDFICPNSGEVIKGKILYDEKEWRSFIHSFEPKDTTFTEFENGIPAKGYLSNNHNLRFTDEDIVEIRIDNVESKDELHKFLSEVSTGLDTELTIDKVKLNDN